LSVTPKDDVIRIFDWRMNSIEMETFARVSPLHARVRGQLLGREKCLEIWVRLLEFGKSRI
jgi:hypothetical protein